MKVIALSFCILLIQTSDAHARSFCERFLIAVMRLTEPTPPWVREFVADRPELRSYQRYLKFLPPLERTVRLKYEGGLDGSGRELRFIIYQSGAWRGPSKLVFATLTYDPSLREFSIEYVIDPQSENATGLRHRLSVLIDQLFHASTEAKPIVEEPEVQRHPSGKMPVFVYVRSIPIHRKGLELLELAFPRIHQVSPPPTPNLTEPDRRALRGFFDSTSESD